MAGNSDERRTQNCPPQNWAFLGRTILIFNVYLSRKIITSSLESPVTTVTNVTTHNHPWPPVTEFAWSFTVHSSSLFFHGSRSVFMVVHGSRLVPHDSWSVFMVFHSSRQIFHGSRLVFHGSWMVFKVFLVFRLVFTIFYPCSRFFMVPGWFPMISGWFSRFFMVQDWLSWFEVGFHGAKLSWCQIVCAKLSVFIILVPNRPVPNCPTTIPGRFIMIPGWFYGFPLF